MKKLLVFLALFHSLNAFADLDLDIDRYACEDDTFSTMSIDVEVNGEGFNFDVDCDWSFRDSFETETGVECSIEGQMCDQGDQDYGYIEVDCDNGDSEEEDFPCARDSKK